MKISDYKVTVTGAADKIKITWPVMVQAANQGHAAAEGLKIAARELCVSSKKLHVSKVEEIKQDGDNNVTQSL